MATPMTTPMGSAECIRVLLIEDHGIVREGIKLILQQSPDIAVVGEAADGDSGLRLVTRLAADHEVDVVVSDLALPDISGLEVTRRIKAQFPDIRVLILTMHADHEHIQGMLDTGADGYLLKQSAAHELAAALRAVVRGETVLAPAVARWLMRRMQRGHEEQAALLTERERQVLQLLATGKTSKEVAKHLGLSAKTVENHRARLLEKLGVTNNPAAIGLAYQQGVITPVATAEL